MANQFTSALAELVACETAEFGTTCQATIGTQTVACVILDDPFNSVVVEGGVSESGQQTIMVDKALLTNFASSPNGQPPINTTPTTVLGVSAFVLSVVEKLGVLYIQTGFPAAPDDF